MPAPRPTAAGWGAAASLCPLPHRAGKVRFLLTCEGMRVVRRS